MEKVLKCHMHMAQSCRSRLLTHVPPIPSVVERPGLFLDNFDDNVARRPPTRLSSLPVCSDDLHQ
jgi:hypothetical protein